MKIHPTPVADNVQISKELELASAESGRPRSLAAIETVLERFGQMALLAGAVIILGVAALIITDFVGRTFFGKPILGTVELARNALVVIIFCQVPATLLAGKMLRVVALYERLSRRGKRTVESIAALMALCLFAALIVNMWHPMIHAFEIGETDGTGSLRTPMGPVRLALMVLWIQSAASALLLLVRLSMGLPPSRQWSEENTH